MPDSSGAGVATTQSGGGQGFGIGCARAWDSLWRASEWSSLSDDGHKERPGDSAASSDHSPGEAIGYLARRKKSERV